MALGEGGGGVWGLKTVRGRWNSNHGRVTSCTLDSTAAAMFTLPFNFEKISHPSPTFFVLSGLGECMYYTIYTEMHNILDAILEGMGEVCR